jgi:hypothetical protein
MADCRREPKKTQVFLQVENPSLYNEPPTREAPVLIPNQFIEPLLSRDVSVCRAVVTRLLGLRDDYEDIKDNRHPFVKLHVQTFEEGYANIFVIIKASAWEDLQFRQIQSERLGAVTLQQLSRKAERDPAAKHADFRDTFGQTAVLCENEFEYSSQEGWLAILAEDPTVDIIGIKSLKAAGNDRFVQADKFTCYNRDILIRQLTESGIVYRWMGPTERGGPEFSGLGRPDKSIQYYLLPPNNFRLDQAGYNALISNDDFLFDLVFRGYESVGTMYAVSHLHGHVEKIFTLRPVRPPELERQRRNIVRHRQGIRQGQRKPPLDTEEMAQSREEALRKGEMRWNAVKSEAVHAEERRPAQAGRSSRATRGRERDQYLDRRDAENLISAILDDELRSLIDSPEPYFFDNLDDFIQARYEETQSSQEAQGRLGPVISRAIKLVDRLAEEKLKDKEKALVAAVKAGEEVTRREVLTLADAVKQMQLWLSHQFWKLSIDPRWLAQRRFEDPVKDCPDEDDIIALYASDSDQDKPGITCFKRRHLLRVFQEHGWYGWYDQHNENLFRAYKLENVNFDVGEGETEKRTIYVQADAVAAIFSQRMKRSFSLRQGRERGHVFPLSDFDHKHDYARLPLYK